VFYAINSDVLSPVSCGALFLCVLHWLRTATPSFLLGALTGLAMAAAYVTKLSTLPQIAVALIAIVANLGWRIRQLPRATFIAFAALVICSVIPIGSWIFWTKHQVAASDFYTGRFLDFLVRSPCEFLAGRG